MSKEKTKNSVKKKNKFRNKKNNRKKQSTELKSSKQIPSLSKREASSNWVTFMKSNGIKGKVFNVKNYDFNKKEETAVKKKSVKTPVMTKVVALDCEMVSDLSDQDMLARVSLVNYKLECIYDKFVKPVSKVGDYRTRFSGVREQDLEKGEDFEIVQQEVKTILFNKILVGHALHNDFKVLKFGHHKQLIRDTSKYEYFREGCDSKSPSLKKLAKVFLNENVQEGEHNSIEDAKTAMKLYKKFRQEWEISLINSKSKNQQEIEKQPQQALEQL